ncbi:MAG TPA: DUF4032 domain-containing protein [Actinotalea sp.]|nr:DUF4032 domain-containing protein [Actinotalea sp.]
MPDRLHITSAAPDPALLDLPWHIALEEWPAEVLAALPRGISRHVVRFVRLSHRRFLAVKEIGQSVAYREYELLRQLHRLEPLEAALITEHLQFSLPYRALFSRQLQPGTSARLVDALTVLLVRLHLSGFYWGDVSLSNTLFRRDAESFAAYLVDAETGDLHERLSVGQRAYDLDVARVNIIGELMDLEAGGLLETEVDPVEFGDRLVQRYHELWDTLTGVEEFNAGERWRVAQRVERLNELGFDVAELDIVTDVGGTTVSIQPRVVEAGHHARRLLRLTGMEVEQNQARRLLNDLDQYRAATDRQGEPEARVARDWMYTVFEPALQAVPSDLRAKLEPAQVFHEMLDHRWFRSAEQGRDVPMAEAAESYVRSVLASRPDEESVLGLDTAAFPRVPDLDD